MQLGTNSYASSGMQKRYLTLKWAKSARPGYSKITKKCRMAWFKQKSLVR